MKNIDKAVKHVAKHVIDCAKKHGTGPGVSEAVNKLWKGLALTAKDRDQLAQEPLVLRARVVLQSGSLAGLDGPPQTYEEGRRLLEFTVFELPQRGRGKGCR